MRHHNHWLHVLWAILRALVAAWAVCLACQGSAARPLPDCHDPRTAGAQSPCRYGKP